MENPLNNPEKENKPAEDDEEVIFSISKKIIGQKLKSSDTPKDTNKKVDKNLEETNFFKRFFSNKKRVIKDSNNELNTDQQYDKHSKEKFENNEHDDSLDETEVHEVVIAIADIRNQELSEQLSEVQPESDDELEIISAAFFYEELLEIASANEDITEYSIDQAYMEAARDLGAEKYDSQVEGDNDSEMSFSSDDEKLDNKKTQNKNNKKYVPNVLQKKHYQNSEIKSKKNKKNKDSSEKVQIITKYIIDKREVKKVNKDEKNELDNKDKISKQVEVLQLIIEQKEQRIRSMTKSIKKNRTKSKNSEKIIEQRTARKEVKKMLIRQEQLINDPKVEKIGRFSLPALNIFHEKRLIEDKADAKKRKSVESMNKYELLDKVAGLKIHGLEVADMYHKKRLTQKTLRKITKEYLRGGNFKKTFSLELLPDEREILKQQLKVNELSKPIKNIPKLENEIQKKTKKYNKPEKKPENKTIENKNIYLTNQMWSKKPKVNHVAELNIVNKPNNIIKTNKKQKQIDISQVNAVVPAIITGLVIGSALIVFWLMN